uniref:Liver-expressed antimicrobial peptide 2 n=1 Tax=Esox lucius TaxID=8010 RepID=A0AAY5KQB4_ESOLU
MKSVQYIAIFMFLALVCAVQMQTAPVPDDWTGMGTGLISRAKRSLLWRWNTLKPVGAGCRDHAECGTKYCRGNTCSFHVLNS